MLAESLREHPCELRADFQQYYGLNIDGMGDAYPLFHAACLCAQLPPESRTIRALVGPERAEALLWTLPVRLAAAQLNVLNVIRWLNTQDGVDGVNFPEPVLPPEQRTYAEPDPEGYKAALASIRERIEEAKRR